MGIKISEKQGDQRHDPDKGFRYLAGSWTLQKAEKNSGQKSNDTLVVTEETLSLAAEIAFHIMVYSNFISTVLPAALHDGYNIDQT